MQKMVMSVKLEREYLTTETIIEILNDIVPSLIEHIYPEIISKIISAPNNAYSCGCYYSNVYIVIIVLAVVLVIIISINYGCK